MSLHQTEQQPFVVVAQSALVRAARKAAHLGFVHPISSPADHGSRSINKST
jgi:hypothetical protein